jgi:inositol transport system substrate-binding protein
MRGVRDMKKMVTCTILVLALTLCFGSNVGAQQKKVAFLVSDMSASYTAWLANSCLEEAKKYPQYKLTIMDSKMSVDTQIANLETAATQKYDMILIQSVDPHALSSQINRTIDAGIPVCVVNAPNTDAPRASNVNCDPVQQGSVPAEIAFKMLPKNAKVVVLHGPSGNYDTIGRRKGFQQVLLDKRPDVTVLDEKIGNWMKDQGMTLMEDWLQRYPKIDAVLGMNDSMALGGIEAAKAAGRMNGMQFYGIDGIADTLLSIKAGEFTATCLQDATSQAVSTMAIVDKVLKGKEKTEVVLTPGVLIDKNNVDHWIEVDKKLGLIK